MDWQERVEAVRDAQYKLWEVIELLDQAVAGSPIQSWAEAYIVDRLRIIVSSDHSFLAGDPSLDELIETLERDREEEGEG